MQYQQRYNSSGGAYNSARTVRGRRIRPIDVQMGQRRSVAAWARCVGRHLANINEMHVSGSTTATRCCSCLLSEQINGDADDSDNDDDRWKWRKMEERVCRRGMQCLFVLRRLDTSIQPRVRVWSAFVQADGHSNVLYGPETVSDGLADLSARDREL